MRAARALQPPLKLKERDVVKQVKDFLAWRGWRAVRMQRMILPGSFD